MSMIKHVGDGFVVLGCVRREIAAPVESANLPAPVLNQWMDPAWVVSRTYQVLDVTDFHSEVERLRAERGPWIQGIHANATSRLIGAKIPLGWKIYDPTGAKVVEKGSGWTQPKFELRLRGPRKQAAARAARPSESIDETMVDVMVPVETANGTEYVKIGEERRWWELKPGLGFRTSDFSKGELFTKGALKKESSAGLATKRTGELERIKVLLEQKLRALKK